MAVTDPEAIKFTNEYVRPMSEHLIALYLSCKALKIKQENIATAVWGTLADVVDDGRADRGVSVITTGDVKEVRDMCDAIIAYIEAVGEDREAKISKPNVRKIDVGLRDIGDV